MNLNEERCAAAQQFCNRQSNCNLPAIVQAVLPLETAAIGKSTEGYVVIANQNALSCPAAEYEIAVSQMSLEGTAASFYYTQLLFGADLTRAEGYSDDLFVKQLYLLPGTAIKTKLRIDTTATNIDAILKFEFRGPKGLLNDTTRIRLSASPNAGGTINQYATNASIESHPFSPQPVNAFNQTGKISSMVPACQVQVVGSPTLLEGEPLRLKATSQYATSMEYNCGNQGWKTLGEGEIFGLIESTNCQFRAVQHASGRSRYADCNPGSSINVHINKVAKQICDMPATSKLKEYSLNIGVRVADLDLGKKGFYFVLGQTKAGQWYSYDGSQWVLGQTNVGGSTSIFLQSVLQPIVLFYKSDLTAFDGSRLYLGYGLGDSSSEALAEMKASQRLMDCATIK